MTTLEGLLQKATPFDTITRHDIVECFWPSTEQVCQHGLDWEPYFAYYVKQCHHALHDQGKHILHRTHQDIADTVEDLQKPENTRENVKANLNRLFTSSNPRQDEILDNSVDLATRLYLMMNIGESKYGICGQRPLKWQSGTLTSFLAEYFSELRVLSSSSIKFEKTFTAVTMEKIAGIKVRWTDNLTDHLRMVDDDDKVVAIFHHASFLKRQNDHIFPSGLVSETLRTLALLFPQHDRATQKWYKALPSTPVIDSQLVRCGHLRLDDRQPETFRFWHDRLIILKQAYDQSSPTTLSQWWHDRRNGVQWYTFWIAALVLHLTILFGLVQSIEGGLQVYKAYHPTPQ